MRDLQDQIILVTGATSGIGLRASVALARRGARVVLVGRDAARTEAAIAEVTMYSGSRDVSALLCDFSSQASIRALAAAFRERHDRLDVLVNNAGGVNTTRRLTVDGLELTFAVNHLGPFLLTNLLLDRLMRAARHSGRARVVTVASIGHRRGTLDFDDLGYARGYRIMRAYARSKLANVLFARELARRLAGTGVVSNGLHPGMVDTRIWSGAPVWARPIIHLLLRPFFISADAGARFIVELAAPVDPALGDARDPAHAPGGAAVDLRDVTGQYFEQGRLVDPSPLARDEAVAARLWEASAELVGLSGTLKGHAGYRGADL